ncbi:MAG: hypothetical protein H0W86_07780 [Armatimonadetes bacterium]|nr:hypothetical protein [Armatimonadota bacterium]
MVCTSRVASPVFWLCFATTQAGAQWTVVDLDAGTGAAYGVHRDQQVGGYGRASLWYGSAGSWTSLHPDGATGQSAAYAVYDGQQVGSAYFASGERAGYWLGTASSWVDLQPPGAGSSAAFGVWNGRQVGSVDGRAALWYGTPGSRVDLHPTGSLTSVARGVYGNQQVGYAMFGNAFHASLWTGSASSFVDLNPEGSGASFAYGVYEGIQAGLFIPGNYSHAALWFGSVNSVADLHPQGVGATGSAIYGVYEGQQVGSATFKQYHAAYWSGSPTSWEDLHPKGSLISIAYGIYDDGDYTYVVGETYWDNTSGHATMWVRANTVVPPTSFSMFRGSVISGDLSSLLDSDNSRLVLRPGAVFSTEESPIQITLHGTVGQPSPTMLGFQVESNTSVSNAEIRIALYNFQTASYEVIERHPTSTTDTVEHVNVTNNPSRFIEPGTRNVRARLSYKALGAVFVYPWFARIDRVRWILPGT